MSPVTSGLSSSVGWHCSRGPRADGLASRSVLRWLATSVCGASATGAGSKSTEALGVLIAALRGMGRHCKLRMTDGIDAGTVGARLWLEAFITACLPGDGTPVLSGWHRGHWRRQSSQTRCPQRSLSLRRSRSACHTPFFRRILAQRSDRRRSRAATVLALTRPKGMQSSHLSRPRKAITCRASSPTGPRAGGDRQASATSSGRPSSRSC
mmetsp:Transcript_140518/g.391714  ORF Transcript_140518/g.391714 Transcript_140518/m.391714 type:complete len:210 (-) Transcript_140518:82-711(-)